VQLKRQPSAGLFPSFRKTRSSLTVQTEISSETREEEQPEQDLLFGEVEIFQTACGIEATMVFPYEAKTLHELALHEFAMKRYDDALDCWAQALGYGDDRLQPYILWNLVKLHLEMGPTSEEHRRAAEMHFENLRPYLQSMQLDGPTGNVLEFLVEQKEWEASVRVAESLGVDTQVLARIYFEQSLGSERPLELLELALSHRPQGKLRRQVYAALIQAHSAICSYERALELSKEQFPCLESKTDIANAYYHEAEIFVALGRTEEAMATLEKSLALLPKSPSLLQAKADLLYLLGKLEESVKLYETVLSMLKDPLEQTKILYTLGRIYHKTGQALKASTYYQRELQTTQKACGENHLECSRIYHEMARCFDDACDYERAINCCEKALKVERLHLPQATGSRRKEVLALIRESKNRIGRIYYKKGDFDSALQSTFGENNALDNEDT